MLISVLVPTYRRPHDLIQCLRALDRQTRKVDQVIVTIRDCDRTTWSALEQLDGLSLPLQTVKVTVPGAIAAMNIGLTVLRGDIVAITDDDSVPHPDWIERIEQHFLADERIAGVGGKDYVYHGDQLEQGAASQVGRLSWFGRMVGNHHIGIGAARDVDFLKGVNMSFRRSAIDNLRFDERMRGTGAQVHLELAFCLRLKQAGWRLIYDPEVAVNHYPAVRFDEDQRQSFNPEAYENAAHNETLILLENLSFLQRIIFLAWSGLIGTRQTFGLLQALRFGLSPKEVPLRKLQAAIKGRWRGWKSWRQSQASRPLSLKPLQ